MFGIPASLVRTHTHTHTLILKGCCTAFHPKELEGKLSNEAARGFAVWDHYWWVREHDHVTRAGYVSKQTLLFLFVPPAVLPGRLARQRLNCRALSEFHRRVCPLKLPRDLLKLGDPQKGLGSLKWGKKQFLCENVVNFKTIDREANKSGMVTVIFEFAKAMDRLLVYLPILCGGSAWFIISASLEAETAGENKSKSDDLRPISS